VVPILEYGVRGRPAVGASLTAGGLAPILPPSMRAPPAFAALRPRLSALWVAVCLVAALGVVPVAHAAPDDRTATDPVLQLLQDKGFVSRESASEGSALVRQVRDVASELVLSAMNFLGVPYRRGGSSADDGFDCRGFTRHIFEMSLGLVLPRRVDDQAKPGDLVFFNTLRRAFSHVGIYLGDNKFIHAPSSGGAVRIESMDLAYWKARFNGARRIETAEGKDASSR